MAENILNNFSNLQNEDQIKDLTTQSIAEGMNSLSLANLRDIPRDNFFVDSQLEGITRGKKMISNRLYHNIKKTQENPIDHLNNKMLPRSNAYITKWDAYYCHALKSMKKQMSSKNKRKNNSSKSNKKRKTDETR